MQTTSLVASLYECETLMWPLDAFASAVYVAKCCFHSGFASSLTLSV